jgi:hypothetical protein
VEALNASLKLTLYENGQAGRKLIAAYQ